MIASTHNIIKMKNTYIQKDNMKNLKFSTGEDLTDLDLEIIKSRSTRVYMIDAQFEDYWGEHYKDYTYVPIRNAFEDGDEDDESFQIGNNKKGGLG